MIRMIVSQEPDNPFEPECIAGTCRPVRSCDQFGAGGREHGEDERRARKSLPCWSEKLRGFGVESDIVIKAEREGNLVQGSCFGDPSTVSRNRARL
ncbi:MAG: hypothetical protein AB7O24_26310 [Kofleriaceae bacterium]